MDADVPSTKVKEQSPRLVAVRATISLPGLPAGSRTVADADAPYVQTCLEHGYLVPAEDE